MDKKEFKKLIREIGFTSQRGFAEDIGVKATTFTTYKFIPSHIERIIHVALLAKQSGVEFEEIRTAIKID